MTNDLNSRMAEIKKIVINSSAIVLEGYNAIASQKKISRSVKADHRDTVTEYDKRTEDFILEALSKSFSGEAVLGEESTGLAKESVFEEFAKEELFWVIDPIDGTNNFSHAYPFFCTTVALVQKSKTNLQHESVLAITYNPVSKECFTAIKGSGAELHSKTIKSSNIKDLSLSLGITGFANRHIKQRKRSFEIFEKLASLSQGLRRDGSAALDLAFVACGRADFFWESGLSPWDVAAGYLLVTEAGGQISQCDGQEIDFFNGNVCATNGHIHSEILAEICE